MDGMRRRRKRARFVALAAAPMDQLLLALFFVLGGSVGASLARCCVGQLDAELRTYIDLFFELLPQREVTPALLWDTVSAYLRASVLAFLCGFAPWGAAVLPLLCLTQGFLFSFSACSFAAVLGRRRFGVLMALFLPRFIVVLPCTLLLAGVSLRRARELAAGRLKSGVGWPRFGVCCFILLLACVLELRLLPQILSALSGI